VPLLTDFILGRMVFYIRGEMVEGPVLDITGVFEAHSRRTPQSRVHLCSADSRKALDFTAPFTWTTKLCNEAPARYYSHTTKMTGATWREGGVNMEYAVSRSLITSDDQFFVRLKVCAEPGRNRIL
jgi:hypothetical protein